jgi:capsular polysaccharide transport system permease protein
MTTSLEQHNMRPSTADYFNKLHNNLLAMLKRYGVFLLAIIATLLSAVYWLAIASDRYVSEAHVIIQHTDISGGQAVDFSSLLSGTSGTSRADQLLLRDYLLSVDMLKKLDATLNLRAHYSDKRYDKLSRMSGQPSIENLHKHYLSRVDIHYDDYEGVLVIKADAYEPKMAHAIVVILVSEGERYMNEMAHSLAEDQVSFLEKQVTLNNERASQARQALLDFQNKKGLVSPQSAAETIVSLVAKLETQKTELETQRSALQAYLVASHPSIVLLNQQIAAVAKQIVLEQAKLASPSGKTLNRTVGEYQQLEREAEFTHDVYKTALVALERVRFEVTRTIKKVSVLQSPTFPEQAQEPRRVYNSFVYMLFIMMLAGVIILLLAIMRDHKD